MAKGNLIIPRRNSTTGCCLASYPGESPKEKKRMIIENRKERFGEKPLHSAHFKETKDVKNEKESWK